MSKQPSVLEKPRRIKGKNGGTITPFVKGVKKGGRAKGQPNKVTRVLKEAIILAAEAVGENKRGKDGLVGYLKMIAWREPASFCSLLGKILPLQITGAGDGPVKVRYESPEEVAEALKARGIPENTIGKITAQVFGANVTGGVAEIAESYKDTKH